MNQGLAGEATLRVITVLKTSCTAQPARHCTAATMGGAESVRAHAPCARGHKPFEERQAPPRCLVARAAGQYPL